MAYKFFSQKLLSSNELDLSQVFPEKQELARGQNNVSYNLADIVLFLKDRTEDFKFVEGQYIDLDNAISEIVNKYYKSIGEKNPFIDDIDEDALKDFEAGVVPREAVIVEEGKQKGKGVAKPAPEVKGKKSKEVVEVKEEPKKLEVVEEETQLTDSEITDRINQFKKQLEKFKEVYLDVYDDDEKADEMKKLEDKLEANELIAEDGDKLYIERVKVLRDLIKSLK
jgi:hypothetical protein